MKPNLGFLKMKFILVSGVFIRWLVTGIEGENEGGYGECLAKVEIRRDRVDE